MASDTSSRVRKRARSTRSLYRPLEKALRNAPVPLLVLRLPEFERVAWRDGKHAARQLERATTQAFVAAGRQTLRQGDMAAHDPGTDVFVIAMAAPARRASLPSPIDCRSVLERVAAAMSLATDLRVESGWTVMRGTDASVDLPREIEGALERGARERERYEFFAAIGHELRTPLTSIRGYLETLLESGIEPAATHRFLQTARREALRMGRLLDGMFEFSLLDLSAGALLGRDCEIGAQIDAACDIVRPAARSRRIALQRREGGRASVALDPDACLQLLVNLIDNAIKYGREGGTVAVSTAADATEVVVSVDDDGPGIAPGERESIFALRVRGEHTKSRPGTGIGLAIVKMIAERAGGRVRVSESPLGGARFEACLPRKAESAVLAS